MNIKDFLELKTNYEIHIKAIENEINNRIIPLLKTINSKYSSDLKQFKDNIKFKFEKLYIRENWVNLKTNEKSETKMFIVLKQTSFDLDNLLIPLDWLEKSNEKILSELK